MTGILGSGSWPTALTKILLENTERHLAWWVREPEVREGLALNHHNPLYLSEALIDMGRVSVSGNIEEVVRMCDDLLLVIPSAFVHKALQGLPEELMQSKRWHVATKGLIPETNQIPSDYLHDTFGVPYERMSVVSGPSHAEEAAKEKLTYLAVASPSRETAQVMLQALECRYVKTKYFDDMAGIEFSSVMKNIYALAAGICHGLGYGDNLIAVMICNAVTESRHFVDGTGLWEGRELERFPFLGDLLVTCYSTHSRNRTFGQLIGHGYTVKGAILEMNMVAEGYYAVKGVEQHRKSLAIEMPIAQAVYKILYERANPRRTMKAVLENLY